MNDEWMVLSDEQRGGRERDMKKLFLMEKTVSPVVQILRGCVKSLARGWMMEERELDQTSSYYVVRRSVECGENEAEASMPRHHRVNPLHSKQPFLLCTKKSETRTHTHTWYMHTSCAHYAGRRSKCLLFRKKWKY